MLSRWTKTIATEILAFAALTVLGLAFAAPATAWASGPVGKAIMAPAYPMPASMGPGSTYIELAIDDDTGQFTMGVPNGPILLYGHPSPWSSFSTVRVDGTDYTNNGNPFGAVVSPPTTVGATNEGIWQVGTTSLRVHQKITLVTGSATGHQDTYLIQYVVENLDTAAHTVGCRAMLDTDLADNDGAPFQVPGTGSILTEHQWDTPNIPSYFFVFNDIATPSVTCEGNLIGGQISLWPDRFQVDEWDGVFGTAFDYMPTGQSIYDSAYAVYWLNKTVQPGQSATFSTYFGLGGIAVDNRAPLASALSAPVALDCVANQLTPNPFDVSLYLTNSIAGAPNPITGISCSLSLPPGLVLASGSATQTVPNMATGASTLVAWTVRADGTASGVLTYQITVASGNYGSKTIQGQITVPAGCNACPNLTLAQVDTSACPVVSSVVAVTDSRGNPVTGLTASNFCLTEDTTAITNFTVTPAGTSGGSLYVAVSIDNSGSLGSTNFGLEKSATKTFVNMLGGSDQAAIYGFTSAVDLVQDFTSNKAALLAAIDAYPYKDGSTAFYESVYQSLTNTGTKSGRKAVIAMTDGYDNSSSHSKADVIALAKSLGIPVYTIGFGSPDTATLTDIATQTGGKYYLGTDATSLQQILTDIGNYLNNQYVVSYTTTKANGAPHALDLCVTYGGCTQHVQGSFTCGTAVCATLGLAQVDTSSCPTVKAVVNVLDASGSPITGLSAGQFCLKEDATAITNFTVTSAASGGALSLALNIDNSGSLGSSNFNSEKAATKAFIGLLGTSDQAAVFGFWDQVDLVKDFTTDKTALNAAIDAYPYKSGMTALYDSLYESLGKTAAKTGRKAVIVMTDGSDTASSKTMADVITYAKSLGIPIYTIGFGSPDTVTLTAIADQTGGKFYASADVTNLQQILADIGALLNSQYIVTYTTSKADGQAHALDICVQPPGCALPVHVQGSFTCGTLPSCGTLTLAQVDTSGCPVVKSVVSVVDAAGNPVTGLITANFCLSEDTVPQNFTVTPASASGGNLYVAVNIDNTGSLGGAAFDAEKSATKTFVNLMGASDQAAIYGFTSSVDLVQDFTSNKATLLAAIDAYPYKAGSTAFYDSVYQSLTNTGTKSGRKAVIAMTDGYDNSSSHSKADVIALAKSLGIPIYTIGFGSPDTATLTDIATQTGGKYYSGADASALQAILTAIGNYLNNQYVVTYTTQYADGQPHDLDICVSYGNCQPVHVQGTFTCGAATCPALAMAPVDTSASPVVKVTVTATSGGNPVSGLAASAFTLSEDGAPKTFTFAAGPGAGQYQLSYNTTKIDGAGHVVTVYLVRTACRVRAKGTFNIPACSLLCNAIVPASVAPMVAASFQGQVTPTGCPLATAFVWSFGDGVTSWSQNPTHAYTQSGPYTWSLTVSSGQTSCTKTGTITVLPPCTVSCTATVPTMGTVNAPVSFASTVTPSYCNGTPTFDWDFGDGSPHSTQQNPPHTYTSVQSFNWTLTVTVDGARCLKTGTIAVSCAYAISPSSKSFTSKGGSVTVTVTASGQSSCGSPSVTTSDSWLTAAVLSYASNKGKVKVTVSKNLSATPRNAQVTIGSSVFDVSQSGAACKVTAVSPVTLTVPASGGSQSVAVTATAGACDWTASPTGTATSWITMIVASGSGPGTATFVVSPNTTGKSRTGTLSVAVPAGKKTVTVKQSA